MSVVTMTPMHKEVHHRTCQENQIWQHQWKVNPVLEQQQTADREPHNIQAKDWSRSVGCARHVASSCKNSSHIASLFRLKSI